MAPAVKGSKSRKGHPPSRELNIGETFMECWAPRLRIQAVQVIMPVLQLTAYIWPQLTHWLSPTPLIFLVWKIRMVKTQHFRTFQRNKYINTSKVLEQCPIFTWHSINIVNRMNKGDPGTAKFSKAGCVLQSSGKSHTQRCKWNFPELCSMVFLKTSTFIFKSSIIQNWKFKSIYL